MWDFGELAPVGPLLAGAGALLSGIAALLTAYFSARITRKHMTTECNERIKELNRAFTKGMQVERRRSNAPS